MMNWSDMALKMTIGIGSLGITALLIDSLKPVVGIYGGIAVILVPLIILVFFKVDELPAPIAKFMHGTAVVWYGGLVIASVAVMAERGFIPSDALMGSFMALGLWPCAKILLGMWAGHYERGQE